MNVNEYKIYKNIEIHGCHIKSNNVAQSHK